MKQHVALVWLVGTLFSLTMQASVMRGADADPPRGRAERILRSDLALRALDLWSGQPLPGARVEFYLADACPVASYAVEPLATVSADDAGWMIIPQGDLPHWSWAYVRADGLAASALWLPHYDPGEIVPVFLRDGHAVPVELLDPMLGPVSETTVEVHVSGGGGPALQILATDARGRVLVPNVGGEEESIWVLGSRYLTRGVDLSTWEDGDPPFQVRCEWGSSVRGRLVDASGRAVSGARVGVWNGPRGPWVSTGADGSFFLPGPYQAPGDIVHVVTDATSPWVRMARPSPRFSFDAPPAFVFAMLREPGGVPAGDGRGYTGPRGRVRARVTWTGGVGVPGATVMAVLAEDGMVTQGETDADGACTLTLPAGEHLVLVGSLLPTKPWPLVRKRLVVGDGDDLEVHYALPKPRPLRVAPPATPSTWQVAVVTAEKEFDVTEHVREGRTIDVPASGEVYLRIDHDSRSFVQHMEPSACRPGASAVGMAWPAETTLRAHLVDQKGTSVRGWIALGRDALRRALHRPGNPSAAPEIRILPGRDLRLYAWSEDPALASAVLELAAVDEGPEIDIGPIVLPANPGRQLRVDLPDGTPACDAIVRFDRGGARSQGRVAEDGSVHFAPGDPLGAVGPGARVRAGHDSMDAPLLGTLEGAPPWHLRWPDTQLYIEMLEGPGDFLVLVDGSAFPGTGEMLLRGFPVGSHEVELAALDHVTIWRKVNLSEGLRVSLQLTPK